MFSRYSTEPIDMSRVYDAASTLRRYIDIDHPEDTTAPIRRCWERLSNDERVEVQKLLKDKAPNCNKMYSTLLKEYL